MNTENNGSVTASPDADIAIKFALPIVMFTHEHLNLFNENAGKLGSYGMHLAFIMLGNMDASRGFIHKFKVKKVAQQLGCSNETVYRVIKLLRDIGFANLKLRHGTVSGRIRGTIPKHMLGKYDDWKNKEDDEPCGETLPAWSPHKMPVGMITAEGIRTLIAGGTTEAHWRLAMVAALNCDVHTGKLIEKTDAEWAELTQMHRVWAKQGFDHLNEIGFAKVHKDYDIIGWVPHTALASAHFNLAKQSKESNRTANGAKEWLKEKLAVLYEAYGINAEGWSREMIEQTWRLLGKEVDKARQKLYEDTADIMPASIKNHITKRTTISGSTTSLAEVLPFA